MSSSLRRTNTILIIAASGAVALFLLVIFAPSAVAAVCTLAPIPLEVSLGSDVTTTTGLTNYIRLVYQFAIAAVGILATVMIMFHGFGWAIAGGNAEDITKAKTGITSAIIGLLFAFGAYTLLNIINPATVNLGDICPAEIGFISAQDSASTNKWESCRGGGDSSCTAHDYCKDGCTCDTVADGSKVCRPTAVGTLALGLRCTNSSNCAPPGQCINAGVNHPGICSDSRQNASCNSDADCVAPQTCIETVAAVTASGLPPIKRCLPPTGRNNLTVCTANEQCTSGICSTGAAPRKCVSGTGDDGDLNCGVNDNNCAPAYRCVSYNCIAKTEGDSCEGTNASCTPNSPPTLFCVENNGDVNYIGVDNEKKCFDGSLQDPCDEDNECQTGLSCITFCSGSAGRDAVTACSDGTEGMPCRINIAGGTIGCTSSAQYCVIADPWGNPHNVGTSACVGGTDMGTCHDGSILDPCDDDSDCNSTTFGCDEDTNTCN